MRDLVITLIVFGAIPFILARPWLGILMWSWLGYMNPHRLSWGFAFDFPFAQVTALATLLGFLFTTERRYITNSVVMAWALFCLWITLTTFFALDQQTAWQNWEQMIKVQLFAALTVILIHSRERLMMLVWVIVLSLGFFGFKGGLFVFRTSGENLVWGPPGSFIEDNNALALALIMTLPLMWFLYTEVARKAARWILGLTMVLSAAAVLGSQSRGAALAGVGMLGALWLKSAPRFRWRLGLAALAIAPILLAVMPQEYFDRISSITEFEQDGSSMGRIRAWRAATDIALARPVVGGGFNSIIEENYRRYAPEVAAEIDEFAPDHFSEAHSIYFKVLGDHGFMGLLLYLTLGVLAYRAAGRLGRGVGAGDAAWASTLGSMIQVSFVGYAVGGAFLGLSYFDLYYCLISIVVGAQLAVRQSLPAPPAEAGAQEQPDAAARPAH